VSFRLSGARREVAFVCGPCGAPVYCPADGASAGAACGRCGRTHPLRAAAEGLEAGAVARCLRCGADRLYTQKDFNRKVGLAVFVVAAILSVPTWGLSLLAATLVDAGLYYLLGTVTICYVCGAQHRGFARNPDHGPFDLHVAEAIDNQPHPV